MANDSRPPVPVPDPAVTPERIARLREITVSLPDLAVTTTEDCWTGSGVAEGATDWCVYDPAEDDPPIAAGMFRRHAHAIAEARNALPDLLDAYERERGEVDAWIRMYLESVRRFNGLSMDVFKRVAEGASLAEVVDLVGDYMDGCDAVDDESIAAFNAAKARAGVSDSENTQ